MGRLALALVVLFPLAAMAEPGMEGLSDGDIVVPHMHRHVIGSGDTAQPDSADSPRTARHPVRAQAKKSAKDLSLLVPDIPADDATTPDDDAAANVAALAGSDTDGSAAAQAAALAGSETRHPAASRAVVSAEPEVATPAHRPVVKEPQVEEPSSDEPPVDEPKSDDTLEATEPVAPAPAAAVAPFAPSLPDLATPPVDGSSDAPQPMRKLRLGAGLAVAALMGANLATTQLDHSDHFLGADTGRFSAIHHDTEYAAFGGMGVLSLVELLSEDSHSLAHKIAFGAALAATVVQAGLLVGTDARAGYEDQMTYSRAHLAASWTAAAAMAVSSVALAF